MGCARPAHSTGLRAPTEDDLIQRLKLREPLSGLSHLAGAVVSVVGMAALLSQAYGKPWHFTAFAIYGASLVVL